MDDDLAITLGILLAVDEATARRIAENLGQTFGATAGKGANKAFDKSFKGGGSEAKAAGVKAGKSYTEGFASQMRSLEMLIKEAAKRATTAQRIEAETAAAQERSVMRSREKAFAASLQQQTAQVKGSIRDQNTAILAASRILVADAQATARQRVEATKTAAKVITDTNKAQQQRDTDTNRAALNNGTKVLTASLNARLAATRAHLAQTVSATEHANRQTTANVTAAARQRVIVTETTGKVIADAAKQAQQRDTDNNRAALTNGTKVLDAALDVRVSRWKAHWKSVANDADHANRRITNADNANARDRSIRLDRALARSNDADHANRQMRIDRSREKGFENLSGVRRSDNEAENLYRTSNAKILADVKRHNASMIAADQQAGVRRTAYIRTALNNLTRVNQSVMTAILTAWRSHHQRRLADESSANRKAEIELQASMDRRLAKIKAGTQQQSLAATANATASERANTALSSGVLGAATGRGMGVASLFAGALGGREIFNILGEFQSIETAFKGIFREVDGGAPRTTQFLKDIQAFARETPFTLSQVSLAAQKMFANRIVDAQDIDATEQLTDKLRRLADAAAATGKTAGQMDMALLGITQIQGTGFMMEELRQVTENIGLPMDEVAKSLGMTVKEMKDAMKEGSIGVKEGLDAIFDALTRIPGAAGASARQAKTLRGAMSQLRDVGEQLVIKFLMPVGNAFAGAALAMGKFGDQLISGRGAWKVARDALGGIVAALTAIIAAKGAIQVVKLLGIGLSAIAAAPVTAALVALVGVLSTFDGLRSKLASLVEGTKNWFLVGYRANVVIDSFSGFVKVITTVGKFARTVQDFTKALVVGTKDWFLVGYRISGVIDEFSNIVLFQTSLGAAARVIVDALRGIWDALGALANTRDFGEFRKALGRIAEDAGKALSPIKDALAEQFGKGVDAAKRAAEKALKSVVGWVGDNMDSIIAGARVASGGALILRMLGLAKGGNFLGAAQLGIGVAIAGALIGAAKTLAKDQTAEEFGKQINEFLQKGIDRAFDAAVIIAAVVGKLGSLVGDVWGALFGGKGGGDTAADPKASISIAAKIAATIKAAWTRATAALGDLTSSIGAWFTESFTAWVVDFPYEVGRKLSSTILQDEVFKALGTAAAAATAAGLFIAGQFLLGFFQGMVDAAPELGGMLKDAFTGALGGDIGTAFAGSILLGMGAVFAGVKLAALAAKVAAKVAAPFRKFSIGFNADSTRDARIGIAGLKREMNGTGSKAADLGMKMARISDAAGKATSGLASLTERSGRNMQALGAQIGGAQGQFVSAGGKLIKVSENVNAATLAGFGKAGSSVEKFREIVGTAMARVGGVLEKLPEQIRTVAAKVRKGWDAIGGAAGAAQTAVGVAVTGITAYYSSMSEDTATQVTGYLATVGQIAAAWKIGGPILGAVAIGSAAIGWYMGDAAKKAKAEAAKITEFAEAAKRSTAGFKDAIETSGDTEAGRLAGAWEIVNTALDDTDGKLAGLMEQFDFTSKEMVETITGGGEAIDAFSAKVTKTEIGDALKGGAENAALYRDELVDLANAFEFISSPSAETRKNIEKIEKAREDLVTGAIGPDEFIKKLISYGVNSKEAKGHYDSFKKSLEHKVAVGSGAQEYFAVLRNNINDAISKQGILQEAQALFAQAQERLKPIGEQLRAVWDGIKSKIDTATTAAKGYIDVLMGREITEDQARLAIFAATDELNEGRREGESEAGWAARQRQLNRDIQAAFADVQGAIAGRVDGDLAKAQTEYQAFVDSVVNSDGTDYADGTFDGMITDLATAATMWNALKVGVETFQPPTTTAQMAEWLKRELADPTDPSFKVALEEAPDWATQQRIIKDKIAELTKDHPTVEAFIEKAGNFDSVLEAIKGDIAALTRGPATIELQVRAVLDENSRLIMEAAFRRQIANDFTFWANGGLVTSPTVGMVGEAGHEAVFPLTNPARMRQIMGIPQVARAFDAAGFGAPIAGNSTGTNYAPVTVDQSQVNHFTIASDTPRATADQIVRRQRSARFLGGHTLPVVIR